MTRRCIRVGDVVVLLWDERGNQVQNFEQYIGTAGIVKRIDNTGFPANHVEFGDRGWQDTWWYRNNKLEVIGDIR